MNAGRCVTLVGCRTGEVAYYFSGVTGPIDAIVDLVGIGNIVEINDPLHFTEQYYTIISNCDIWSSAEPCRECAQSPNRVNDDTGELIQFWAATPFGSDCPDVDRAFVLVNCRSNYTFNRVQDIVQTPDTALVTSTDLTAYEGMVVNILEYPGVCFTVLGPYEADTGCPCDLFNQIKNGIQNCCDNIDFDKLWIKKELSDYSRINPPDQCVTIIPAVVVPCEGPDPLPISCLPPEDITALPIYE